jgi:ABC-type proline/glycine betaine transport system permease subunit
MKGQSQQLRAFQLSSSRNILLEYVFVFLYSMLPIITCFYEALATVHGPYEAEVFRDER